LIILTQCYLKNLRRSRSEFNRSAIGGSITVPVSSASSFYPVSAKTSRISGPRL
jgi:hypothetical protein